MTAVLKTVLSMSVSGGLLIAALLLGKRVWKDRVSRQWQYYIWLAVLLRLLLPFTPEISLLGGTFQAIDRAVTQAVSGDGSAGPGTGTPADGSAGAAAGTPAGSLSGGPADGSAGAVAGTPAGSLSGGPADGSAQNATAPAPLPDPAPQLLRYGGLLWLAVALGLLIRKITIYQGFVHYIRAGAVPVSDIETLDRLAAAAERAGVHTPVELCIDPLISSPLLTGFFRPCIVLPSADVSETEFRYVVLHELTHYKRRDMFYKWLVQLTVCLHWFNPLVHCMSRELERACEFSCDEAVLAKTGRGSAQAYGKTLLDAMAAVGKYRESVGSVTLSENKQLLQERLGAIMKFQERSKVVKALTALLTACVVLSAAFVGVYTIGAAGGNAAAALLSSTVSEGRPSLSMSVSSAAVNVLAAEGSTISAEYDPGVYQVAIDQQSGDWKVSISCKTRSNTDTSTIKLYLPDVAYGNVNLSVDSGHLTCGLFRSGSLAGSFRTASVFLTLPKGFTGSVDAVTDSGYFQLVSLDDFRNASVTILDQSEWGEIDKPKGFQTNGNTSTYTDGTGATSIRLTSKGSGLLGVYPSGAFKSSAFLEEPDGFGQNAWTDVWDTVWQGAWDAAWQGAWDAIWPGVRDVIRQETRSQLTGGLLSGEWQDTGPDAKPAAAANALNDAARYYEADSLPLFEIAFSRQDEASQRALLDRIYADDEIAYWAAALGQLDEASGLFRHYAEKAYADDEIAFFSTLTEHLDEAALNAWLDRALQDGRWDFQSVLYTALDREPEFEAHAKELEAERAAEYQAVGVTVDGGDYSYQGRLVRVFLDVVQPNRSFYQLDINPAGTVDIRIVRNAENQITGVAYLTDTELAEFFGYEDDGV